MFRLISQELWRFFSNRRRHTKYWRDWSSDVCPPDLIVSDRIGVMAGFGLTPLALASAPLATQGKVPAVVMAAATSTITEASPFVVRTSFTAAQATVPLADWAAKNGLKKVTTLVSDYGPGIDVEKAFTEVFTKAGGQVENLRVPLANPDFSPFLQKDR